MSSFAGSTLVPSLTIFASAALFFSASFFVGSSSLRPLMKMTSALLSTLATLGAGSKVWLLVPSGTMPVTSAASPTTWLTMLVIGTTVVTTWRRPAVVAPEVGGLAL